MSDGNGLRIETAASVVLRRTIQEYLHTFSHVVVSDHAAGKSVHAEATNLLAGVVALIIAGGHGSKDDVLNGTVAKLREYVDRDLQHLGKPQ